MRPGRAAGVSGPAGSGFLAELNPEQRQAVEHFEGPCLALAGPGSGKTRVLTARICRLVLEHGVAPDRILAVTFTNKAAAEMRRRASRMLGGGLHGIWMGTFHGVGARLLRRHAPRAGLTTAFTIRNAEQTLREIKRVAGQAGVDTKKWPPKELRVQISAAKNALQTPAQFAENAADGADPRVRAAARAYPAYQKSLRAQDAADFDDLLMLPVQFLREDDDLRRGYGARFSFILVDEYQDTNRAQFRLIELLARDHRNLMVVGDDDQSIYGWRGADVRNILEFESAFPGSAVVTLERNYRSTQAILDAANAVIGLNEARKEKAMRTMRAGGAGVTLAEADDEMDEARWIVQEIERLMLAGPELRHRDFAVLYRTNAQSRGLEERFRRRGLPYQIVGGVRFYERREVLDLLAYLGLVANPKDDNAFLRVVNYPRRGLGRVACARLAAFAAEQGAGLLQAAENAHRVPGLAPAAARKARAFAKLIRRHAELSARVPAGELLRGLVEEIGMIDRLRAEAPEDEDRVQNVKELIAGAQLFDAASVDGLEEDLAMQDQEAGAPRRLTDVQLFLQHVALITDVDQHDEHADAVALMTLHTAKGLEFPVVFVSGVEEGIIPIGSDEEPDRLEEERRLLYVGMTRAQDRLILTHARRRRRYGEYSSRLLSSFVTPILDMVEERDASGPGGGRRAERRRRALASLAADRNRGQAAVDVGYDDGDDFDQDRPRYAKGERVVHPTFGAGAIVSLDGVGPGLKVVVDFDDAGRRKLVARYAGLQKDFA